MCDFQIIQVIGLCYATVQFPNLYDKTIIEILKLADIINRQKCQITMIEECLQAILSLIKPFPEIKHQHMNIIKAAISCECLDIDEKISLIQSCENNFPYIECKRTYAEVLRMMLYNILSNKPTHSLVETSLLLIELIFKTHTTIGQTLFTLYTNIDNISTEQYPELNAWEVDDYIQQHSQPQNIASFLSNCVNNKYELTPSLEVQIIRVFHILNKQRPYCFGYRMIPLYTKLLRKPYSETVLTVLHASIWDLCTIHPLLFIPSFAVPSAPNSLLTGLFSTHWSKFCLTITGVHNIICETNSAQDEIFEIELGDQLIAALLQSSATTFIFAEIPRKDLILSKISYILKKICQQKHYKMVANFQPETSAEGLAAEYLKEQLSSLII